MTKSIEDQFADWESHVFGYGYGTGEAHVLPALRAFMLAIPDGRRYDYEVLEAAVGHSVAWLLINALAHAQIIDYGTSPRYGWLSEEGRRLWSFVTERTDEQLYELTAKRGGEYVPCYPDACNCGPDGYEEGKRCSNPFWS